MDKTFKILVEEGQDGYFIGEVPELPGCYSQGRTVKELMVNIKEAIELYLESMDALNKKPQKRFFEIKEVVVNA
ncbi:MAG: type II toxin-antitoxin system HicB family antitoxin [archaeon]